MKDIMQLMSSDETLLALAGRVQIDTFAARGVNSQHSTPAGRPLQVVAL